MKVFESQYLDIRVYIRRANIRVLWSILQLFPN